MPVLPGAEPYAADGGDVGVLFCHGFTGTPQSLRPWAEAVAAAGATVRLPRLPGHGTSVAELQRTRWPDWYGEVDRALDDLVARCGTVVVAGLSMGGALALRLAQQRPDDVAGLVLVNPSVLSLDRRLVLLPLLKRVVPTLPGVSDDLARDDVHELAYDRLPLRALDSLRGLWREVRDGLPGVRCPLLVFRSAVDHVVEAESTAAVLAGVGSHDVEAVVLADSWHVATLDHDAPRIVAGTLEFLRTRAGLAAAPAPEPR